MSGGSELGNVRVASSAPPPPNGDEPSLFMSIFRRRKRFVLVATAVAVLTTLAATAAQTKTYSATSTALVSNPPGALVANMATEAQIARSTAVASAAARELGLNVAPSELLSRLGVFVPADSNVVKFTYSSPRPEDAQAGAQAFAKAFTAVRRQQFEDTTLLAASSTAKRINRMRDQLSAINLQLEHAVGTEATVLRDRRDTLTTMLTTLQQALAEQNGQVSSFTPAVVAGGTPLPTSPSKPNVPLNVFLGLLGGLMIGFAIAALAEFLDDRVRSATDLQGRLGASVLGLIPKDDRKEQDVEPTLAALHTLTSRSGDAYRRLSTNFAAAATQAGAKSVAITSVDRDDSPAELITNLAALLAASGKRVVLVTMARRWPALEEAFGAAPGPGLLDALVGTDPIQHALADTQVENLWLCRRGRPDLIEIGVAHAPGDRPRAVGVPSSAPAHVLGSERTAQLIADLVEPFDFVLVDAPALLGDADAAALARACDAVLGVATPTTTRADIARSREQLEHLRATLLGSVFIEVSGRRKKGLRKPVSSARGTRESVKHWVKLPRAGHGRTMR
jgi:capsular polysaccharide biosynthesis protein/Mrp family chromosome partitioning ATPase